MTLAPIFSVTLSKTYYDKGFFNVRRAADRFIRADSGPISIQAGTSLIKGRVDRDANLNGTARVHGHAELRNWLQRTFDQLDVVHVVVLAPDRLLIQSTPRG